MTLSWTHAEPPLAVGGALALGVAARALGERLLERDVRCPALAGDGVLVALDADAPWVESATWIGVCPDAPSLWLPTLRRPTVPAAMVLKALRLAGHTGPLLLTPHALYPLAHARTLDPPRLRAWLEG